MKVLKVIGACAAVYLLMGLGLALVTMPEQLWRCPDPTAPHGYTTGNLKKASDCRTTVTFGERALHLGLVTTLWAPLVVGKALSGD